jgi:hypothetical protein
MLLSYQMVNSFVLLQFQKKNFSKFSKNELWTPVKDHIVTFEP